MIRYKKFQIRYVDNGLEKIKNYLMNLELYELEKIHERYLERFGHFYRHYSNDGSWVLKTSIPRVTLWDQEAMIETILGCYSIFAQNGLFDFMEKETKGELTFGKF